MTQAASSKSMLDVFQSMRGTFRLPGMIQDKTTGYRKDKEGNATGDPWFRIKVMLAGENFDVYVDQDMHNKVETGKLYVVSGYLRKQGYDPRFDCTSIEEMK